jgi:hypothetical protein
VLFPSQFLFCPCRWGTKQSHQELILFPELCSLLVNTIFKGKKHCLPGTSAMGTKIKMVEGRNSNAIHQYPGPERDAFRREKEGDDLAHHRDRSGNRGRPAPKDNLQPYTWCVIEEIPFENWGIGGNQVTPEMLKAVLEGKA